MNKENKGNNAELSARIVEFIEITGNNPNSFAKELGYNRAQTVYDVINGKCAPSYDFFKRLALAEISANLNFRWLLLGQGEIFSEFKHNLSDKDLTFLVNKVIEQAEEIGRLRQQLAAITQDNSDL